MQLHPTSQCLLYERFGLFVGRDKDPQQEKKGQQSKRLSFLGTDPLTNSKERTCCLCTLLRGGSPSGCKLLLYMKDLKANSAIETIGQQILPHSP